MCFQYWKLVWFLFSITDCFLWCRYKPLGSLFFHSLYPLPVHSNRKPLFPCLWLEPKRKINHLALFKGLTDILPSILSSLPGPPGDLTQCQGCHLSWIETDLWLIFQALGPRFLLTAGHPLWCFPRVSNSVLYQSNSVHSAWVLPPSVNLRTINSSFLDTHISSVTKPCGFYLCHSSRISLLPSFTPAHGLYLPPRPLQKQVYQIHISKVLILRLAPCLKAFKGSPQSKVLILQAPRAP